MTLPILIQSTAGQFSASLLGSPEIRFVGSSKEEAIAGLQHQLSQKMKAGEIVNMELAPGISGLAGRFADDPSLREICDEIYRERDADRNQ
jgi:hypothetical protein